MGHFSNGKVDHGTAVLSLPCSKTEGMLLLDTSFRLLAWDRGASRILNSAGQNGFGHGSSLSVPDELLQAVRQAPDDLTPPVRFRLGPRTYTCRAYLMDGQHDDLPGPVWVVHIQGGNSIEEWLSRLASEYHLTDREQEALKGIVMGFSSKELATQMKISPNTVKAFLRLIMIKMGVTSRAAIVAKLLEHGDR